ncbi:MAG TPA: type III secretion system export apparatus subunit SctR [Geminicoccaceae bacterium]|nr:type III secretion system export apparatus subunit SctR [Geminicoccaceae bacterium]
MTGFPDPFVLVLIFGGLALVPFIVVMVTSFAKIVIVLFLIRNALGVQQAPPNMVLYGITIILTLYISFPLLRDIWEAVDDPTLDYTQTSDWATAAERARVPFRAYLLKYTEHTERAFFLNSTQRLWPEEARRDVSSDDLLILVPAFTVSELTKAFEIGFLLYLPFIAIDLIVSNILLAMGMMMVSPLTISLPFKLFLFVVVDGWTRLIHGLVLSYE